MSTTISLFLLGGILVVSLVFTFFKHRHMKQSEDILPSIKDILPSVRKIEESSRHFGSTVNRLNDFIHKTPETLSTRIDDRLKAVSTVAESVGRLKNSNDILDRTIQQHAAAVKTIPQLLSGSVSQEVQSGLNPIHQSVRELDENMRTTYQDMSQALGATVQDLSNLVVTLKDRDFFTNWTDRLDIAVNSLVETGRALQNFFEDTQQAGQSMQTVAECVRDSQDRIGAQLLDLGKLNQFRGIEQKLFHKEIADLFQDNLAKIESEHRSFRSTIDTFIQAVEKDSQIRDALREHIPSTLEGLHYASDQLRQLMEKVESIPDRYAEILTKVQETAKENEKELYRVFQKALESLNTAQQKGQSQITQTLEETVQQLNRLMVENQKTGGEQIAAMAKQQQALSEKMVSLSDNQQNRFSANLKELNQTLQAQLEAQAQKHAEYLQALSETHQEHRVQFAGHQKSLMKVLDKAEPRIEKWSELYDSLFKKHDALNEATTKAMAAEIAGSFGHLRKTLNDGFGKVLKPVAQQQQEIELLIDKTQNSTGLLDKLLISSKTSLESVHRTQQEQARQAAADIKDLHGKLEQSLTEQTISLAKIQSHTRTNTIILAVFTAAVLAVIFLK